MVTKLLSTGTLKYKYNILLYCVLYVVYGRKYECFG